MSSHKQGFLRNLSLSASAIRLGMNLWPPFVGAGAGEVLGAHQYVPAPRVREFAPQVSRELDALIDRLLAKQPDQRIQSTVELVRLLGASGSNAVSSTGSQQHVAVVATGSGVTVDVPANIDPTRRSGKVTLSGTSGDVLTGARGTLVDIARLTVADEAIGLAGECTTMAAE